MNLKPITLAKIRDVNDHRQVLQNQIEIQAAAMQTKRNQWDSMRIAKQKENMTAAEFVALFPSPPSTASFDSQISTLQTQLTSLKAIQNPSMEIVNQVSDVQGQINSTKSFKQNLLDDYTSNLTKPNIMLTDAQFLTLYPRLSDTDFTEELAATATARNEDDALGSFLASGPYPNPGNYDVSLLSTTTITYP